MKPLAAPALAPLLAPIRAAALAAALASAPASPAQAQEVLRVGGRQTLAYPRAIGRIEVDRDDVIAVTAPTARSVRVKGLSPGNAVLSVYAADGSLMRETALSVAARAAAPGLVADKGEQVVAVDVRFAAVSASTLKALGFNFTRLSGDIQGAVFAPSTLSGVDLAARGLAVDGTVPLQNAFNLFLSAPDRGINAVLSALSSNGLSQLLAQPTLLVRSGEQASFLAGGEIPVPVPQTAGGASNTISIEYKEFGVRLAVTPFVLSRDRIVLRIAPEVSELDYGIGVRLQGYVVPGLRRRSAETTVELGSGQSFIIAGLSYSNSAITREKIPFLGDVPVLGAFFKRQQNQKERQELVIVATPRLVGPLNSGDIPPLPGSATAQLSPSVGDMLLGTDGLDQHAAPFGVIR